MQSKTLHPNANIAILCHNLTDYITALLFGDRIYTLVMDSTKIYILLLNNETLKG